MGKDICLLVQKKIKNMFYLRICSLIIFCFPVLIPLKIWALLPCSLYRNAFLPCTQNPIGRSHLFVYRFYPQLRTGLTQEDPP